MTQKPKEGAQTHADNWRRSSLTSGLGTRSARITRELAAQLRTFRTIYNPNKTL